MRAVDYVVIGAGSAGSVLANRLSADPGSRVLLLEAGGPDNHLFLHMPFGVGHVISAPQFNWGYHTEAQAALKGRRLFWPRGKVLGGSSSINGMIHTRGHAFDYDRWASFGLKGWSYAEVLPYFRRVEDFEGGADAYHGVGGPLHVSRPRLKNPLFRAFVEAGREAGHPYTNDFNGRNQEGFGFYPLTVFQGRRQSAAVAYLAPALGRPNLAVETRAHATRVLFHGHRAAGVEYVRGGRAHQVWAEREVILCGGTVNTPQLLMLSGIGPADALRGFALDVVADLPGVGQNLQDHLDVAVHYECTQPVTLFRYQSPLAKLTVLARYMASASGPGQEQGLEAGAFLRSPAARHGVPDLQMHFVSTLMYDHARKLPDRHGFTVHVCDLRPEAHGSITLRSADPFAGPLIQPNYLASARDLQSLRDGIEKVRDVIGQRALDSYRGPELAPGVHALKGARLDDFIRSTAETLYHPVGTARMGLAGETGEGAVVDNSLCVFGTEGLRVVDASVMPTLVGGNTNAPTLMIAERAADLILGQRPLVPALIDETDGNVIRESHSSFSRV